MHKKIKQGTKITCPECDEVIAIANTNIEEGALIRAELFDYPNTPCQNGDKCICLKCGSEYVRVITFTDSKKGKCSKGMIHTEFGWL